ncbi:hypothetical protein F2Q69_00027429 [Brassica cretica]|uniref:Replication factor A C-terminal domain-containing protein n=1 Tax=Brassica cretica TaxID=69181 RepID=A0A8S9S7A2_BRACR|nr:hypothetical protein F2Q69_00027429 [Brassica cretica]
MALFFNDVVACLGWSFFLLMNSGHVLNVYLWDRDANEFYHKFTDSLQTPTDPLVTTVNTKHIGVNAPLGSCPYLEFLLRTMCLRPLSIYFGLYPSDSKICFRLAQNQGVAAMVNASEVTKVKTLTIREMLSLFNCIATIDNVVWDSRCYKIACSDCQTKVNRGLASLICPKCDNVNATKVARYCSEMLAYDKGKKAIL